MKPENQCREGDADAEDCDYLGAHAASSLWQCEAAMVAPSDRVEATTESGPGVGVSTGAGPGGGYMRKTPKRVSRGGALRAAESPRESTVRVSDGSTIPSSQRRALA